MWFWNGMPVQGRDVTGWMFSRGPDNGLGPHGDHLGLGGMATAPGRLIFLHGSDREGVKPLVGRTTIERWTWNHVVMVRDGDSIMVFLNGNSKPEIKTTSPADFSNAYGQLFFGGRCDNESNWEGRLDEIAVFGRVLTTDEIKKLAASQ
jgi:hypothetical protein